MSVKFAIVGIGHIAKKHIQAIKDIENAELVALCDNDPNRLEEYSREYKVFTDLEEMLKTCPEINVVNICVPSGLHAKLTVLCAKYGKHVIVEKPIALKLEDAKQMIDVCQQNNVKLAVIHPNRFRPAIMELKQKVDSDSFGKLSHANATVRWNRNQAYYEQAPWRGTKEFDGGVLMNQAIHNLDLLIWMMGPIESVQAMAATRVRKIEAEDVAGAVVKFKNGALGIIEATTAIYPENLEESLSIFGENGSAKISGKNANFIETWNFKDVSEESSNELKEKVKQDPFGKPGHHCIIEDMVNAIHEDRTPVVTGQDGLAPVKLILAILESAEKGTQISL
ncbi:MAG TPA: Gfo/Idh/MocA family oxidoreductase [Niallia sp.]|nr:Gfo/Idh/MocA family oxidoreductase [Niallia sp.]